MMILSIGASRLSLMAASLLSLDSGIQKKGDGYVNLLSSKVLEAKRVPGAGLEPARWITNEGF
jgi:hypothetical protein